MTPLNLCAAKWKDRASEPRQLLVSLVVFNPVIIFASFLWAPTCAQVYWGMFKRPDHLSFFFLHVAIWIYEHSLIYLNSALYQKLILRQSRYNAQVLFCITACMNTVFQGLILYAFFFPSSITFDLAALKWTTLDHEHSQQSRSQGGRKTVFLIFSWPLSLLKSQSIICKNLALDPKLVSIP